MNGPSGNGTKRLYRLRDGRIVSGVCVGLGAYFGVDPTLVRLAFALLCALGGLTPLPVLSALDNFGEDFAQPIPRVAAE